jgi:hypothetical protein
MTRREPIAYLAQPMSFYRVHAGGLSTNTRFLRGIDRIMARIAKEHDGEAHFQNLVRRRRADVRLDLAWDLLAAGRKVEARQLIAEAGGLARTWKGLKLRLRSFLPG